jgi:SAM-dependent methyltransferase
LAVPSWPARLAGFRQVNAKMSVALSDKVIDLYRRHASEWDAARRRAGWNDRAWIDAFANELVRGSQVLDLGCGGGEPVARFLVDHGLRVTGIDSSPELLALARHRLPEQDWIVGDMRRIVLNRRFDGILAWDSYFHLSHDAQRAMFSVFDAHAGDRAVLLFNTGPGHGESASTFTFKNEPLYHASLAPEEYRALLDRHGFEVIRHVTNDAQGGGRTAWLCRRKPVFTT